MNEEIKKPANKKKLIVIVSICVILIIFLLGIVGWYFFLRKLPEGKACQSSSRCQAGLKCANQICSSGKMGAACDKKDDCQQGFCVFNKCTDGNKGAACAEKGNCLTDYCVNNKCTEGKSDDACATYKDCEKGLLCRKGSCSTPPDYSKYFTSIIISKMKIGLPPGPDNPTTPTTEFNRQTDSIEIDFRGVKPTTKGEFWYELVDSVTGEVSWSTQGNKQQLDGTDRGTGSDLPVSPGNYDLNIYFNDELVYSTTITVK